MEEQNHYKNLKEPITIAVLCYKVKITAELNSLDDYLEALPRIILMMLRDKKNIEDIVEVTGLASDIIRNEVAQLEAQGLIKEYNITDRAKEILEVYDVITWIEQLQLNTYIEGLTGQVFELASKDIQVQAETEAFCRSCVKYKVKSGRHERENQSATEVLASISKRNKSDILDNISVGYIVVEDIPVYILKQITTIPDFSLPLNVESIDRNRYIQVQIPYRQYSIIGDKGKDTVNIELLTGQWLQDIPNPHHSSTRGKIKFSKNEELHDTILKQNCLEKVKFSNLGIIQEVEEKDLYFNWYISSDCIKGD